MQMRVASVKETHRQEPSLGVLTCPEVLQNDPWQPCDPQTSLRSNIETCTLRRTPAAFQHWRLHCPQKCTLIGFSRLRSVLAPLWFQKQVLFSKLERQKHFR